VSKFKLLLFLLVVLVVVVFSGCTNMSQNSKPDLASDEVKLEIDKLNLKKSMDDKRLDIKIAEKPKKTLFVDKSLFDVTGSDFVVFNTLNYDTVMPVLGGLLNKRVLVDVNLKSDKPTGLNYTGTVKGLLDNICYSLKCSWSYKDDIVYLTKYQTRHWRLPLLPTDKVGRIELTSGSRYGSQNSSGSSGGGEEGVKAESQGALITGEGGQSLSSSFSYVANDSVKSLVEPFLSKDDGSYTYSPQTGLLSVTASNMTLEMIDSSFVELKSLLTQMVNFDVTILIYEETNTDQLGLRWDLIWSNLRDLGINFSNNSNVDATADSIGFSVIENNVPFSGSSALIQALSEHVRIASKKDFSFRILSNQMLPISVSDELPFQIIQSTLIPNVGVAQNIAFQEKSVGLHLNMLPVILNDDELLVEFKASFTTLNDVVEIDLGDNGSARIPQTSVRETMQQLKMKNGESVILSGFNMSDSNISKRSPFKSDLWAVGGSRTGKIKNSSMLILVTPKIIK